MQFIFCYIIGLAYLYPLVISAAPIDQNLHDTQHDKASAAANRLLKELADEQMKADMEDQDDVEYIPIIEYPDRDSDESASSEAVNDFDDFPPKYYDSELTVDLDDASESDEDSIPAKHTPIMDDSIMKVENH